ncbi:tensin-4-like isoform 2-T2 [Odontesthes bonariensis]
MMPTPEGMSHMIPSHVLRVGQTIRLDSQNTVTRRSSLTESSSHCDDPELDISLENLNQLILELDPTFEPIKVNKSPTRISPQTDLLCSDDFSHPVLVPRGCPSASPTVVPSVSPSIPIPTNSGLSCSPLGSLVFSNSPTFSLPPLPCGSAPRRIPSPKQDISQGSLRLSPSNRHSATSLLSMSTCSDTSYILGSNLSLAGEDADSPESIPTCTPYCFNDGSRTRPFDSRPSLTKQEHLQELNSKGARSSPTSLSGSPTDIPLLLINGAPEPDLNRHSSGPVVDFHQSIPASPSKQKNSGFQAYFSGSEPSMKFVMDTSKFWFRPHVNRAEAEALLKDKEAGTFVVRDSTSYRGSFGLAMKVNQSPTNFTAAADPGESSSDLIRHFLIESSAKGVRVRGSSQEPYFGSLSALVYQHTITANALPCRLLLPSQDLDTAEERANETAVSEDKSKTGGFPRRPAPSGQKHQAYRVNKRWIQT